MFCPKCGAKNEEGNRFCLSCGNALSGEAQVQQSSIPAGAGRSSTQSQRTALTGTVPSFESSNVSIWGPFAGWGLLLDHAAWLVPQQGDKIEELVSNVNKGFEERRVPGVTISKQHLTAKGVFEATRPYYIIKRGLVSVGLYVTDFGKDLYVSIVSYLKAPTSNLKVIILLAMGLITIFGGGWWAGQVFGIADSAFSSYGGPDLGDFFSTFCIFGPLILISQIGFVLFWPISVFRWIRDRDFWSLLRVSPNEFHVDDVMSLKKAVEQTITISLDEIGIPPEEFIPIQTDERRRII